MTGIVIFRHLGDFFENGLNSDIKCAFKWALGSSSSLTAPKRHNSIVTGHYRIKYCNFSALTFMNFSNFYESLNKNKTA